MAKKKYKEKVKTVYVQPTDEQVKRAIIETTPMKEEMESWMGCKAFTLSCINLHATMEELINITRRLHMEFVPIWFEEDKELQSFMQTYLSDVEVLLKMVNDLKLIKKHEEDSSCNPK